MNKKTFDKCIELSSKLSFYDKGRFFALVSIIIEKHITLPQAEHIVGAFSPELMDCFVENKLGFININEIKTSCANKESIEIILAYLNSKTGKKFKSNNSSTISLINARMKEGFSISDFKIVIDKKTTEWLNDTKYNLHLRPSTLFGNKFEGYLNQNVRIQPSPQPSQYANYFGRT